MYLKDSEASFERKTIQMNNPIEIFSVIVSVYAYMHGTRRYYDVQKRSLSASICFDIDEDRKEITLITRLPKKPDILSNVSYEVAPGEFIIGSLRSIEDVLICAKLMYPLFILDGIPIRIFIDGRHDDVPFREWQSNSQLKSLFYQMNHSFPNERISMIEAIKGINDLQFSQPWISKFFFHNNIYKIIY